MKTYREVINTLIENHHYDVFISVDVFFAYCKHHNINPYKNDFFAKDGDYAKFLEAEWNGIVLDEGVQNYLGRNVGHELIKEGERLIRKGFKMLDEASPLSHSDYIGGRPRVHTVSLVGIHDEKSE